MYNILLFTRCMGSGGTETVIIQLAKCYREAGHQVFVCAADGKGADKLRDMDIPFFPIPDMQNKNPVVAAKICSRVLRLLREKKIDVVHTHHRMAAFYARLLRPFSSFVFLNNIHNTFEDKHRLTRFALRKAVNIAVGEAVKRNMVDDYGLPESIIRVIPNAVLPPVFSEKVDPLLSKLHAQGKFVIANIGRVSEQKGFTYYLEAAAQLKDKPFAFLVVGDGELMEQMQQKAQQLQLTDTVHFLGYRKDVADVMQWSDLIVLSSLWEGFPLTPIEAFGVGRTIVATEVPGTLEIVVHEENGLIVPLQDPAAIAEALVRLYEDEKLRRELEQGARQTYAEKFSYDAFRQKYIALMQEVCP